MTTDDLLAKAREVARQAAREAVAREHDAERPARAAKIRNGERDDELYIHGALAGADAAVSAALPVIVRAAAEAIKERQCINGLIIKSSAAAAILALTPETTP